MNLLNPASMLTARQSADYLRLADNTFLGAVKSGLFLAQMSIPRGGKTDYGFAVKYLDDVNRILPKGRGPGVGVFNGEVQERLKALKKKWEGAALNFDDDAKDTIRATKQLAAMKARKK